MRAINGYLALLFIFRDHLNSGSTPLPFLPWLFATENTEHCFGDMRLIAPDFSFQQAIFLIPKLHALALASHRAKFSQPSYKATKEGYHYSYLNSHEPIQTLVNLLNKFPTDTELAQLRKRASEENEALWTLIGPHPQQTRDAPIPAPIPSSNGSKNAPKSAKTPAIPSQASDQNQTSEVHTERELLHKAIRHIETATNLTFAEENQLEACTVAEVANAINVLIQMYVHSLKFGSPASYL